MNPVVAIRWTRTLPAHTLARAAVAQWMGLDETVVVVRNDCVSCGGRDHGRPSVERIAGAPPPPHLSLTHPRGLAMVALTRAGPVGIDCEPVGAGLLEGFDDVALAPTEARSLRRWGPAIRSAGRLRYWVRKEAVLKATGLGLATDPREVVVSGWREPARVLRDPAGGDPAQWRLWDVDPCPGYLGAVAVRSRSAGPLEVAGPLGVAAEVLLVAATGNGGSAASNSQV